MPVAWRVSEEIRSITASGGGLRSKDATKRATSSSSPSTSISTPALSLETVPNKLCAIARLKTNGRNPTPWTIPSTRIRFRMMGMGKTSATFARALSTACTFITLTNLAVLFDRTVLRVPGGVVWIFPYSLRFCPHCGCEVDRRRWVERGGTSKRTGTLVVLVTRRLRPTSDVTVATVAGLCVPPAPWDLVLAPPSPAVATVAGLCVPPGLLGITCAA